MTEDDFANVICDDFEKGEVMWAAVDVSPQVANVIYWQSALAVVEETPFRQEFVQNKVSAFIKLKLKESQERLLRDPMDRIRRKIQQLDENLEN